MPDQWGSIPPGYPESGGFLFEDPDIVNQGIHVHKVHKTLIVSCSGYQRIIEVVPFLLIIVYPHLRSCQRNFPGAVVHKKSEFSRLMDGKCPGNTFFPRIIECCELHIKNSGPIIDVDRAFQTGCASVTKLPRIGVRIPGAVDEHNAVARFRIFLSHKMKIRFGQPVTGNGDQDHHKGYCTYHSQELPVLIIRVHVPLFFCSGIQVVQVNNLHLSLPIIKCFFFYLSCNIPKNKSSL